MTEAELASLDFFDEDEFMLGLGKDSKLYTFLSFASLLMPKFGIWSDIEVPDHLVPPDPDDGDSMCHHSS